MCAQKREAEVRLRAAGGVIERTLGRSVSRASQVHSREIPARGNLTNTGVTESWIVLGCKSTLVNLLMRLDLPDAGASRTVARTSKSTISWTWRKIRHCALKRRTKKRTKTPDNFLVTVES
jgi:hypothetical protein